MRILLLLLFPLFAYAEQGAMHSCEGALSMHIRSRRLSELAVKRLGEASNIAHYTGISMSQLESLISRGGVKSEGGVPSFSLTGGKEQALRSAEVEATRHSRIQVLRERVRGLNGVDPKVHAVLPSLVNQLEPRPRGRHDTNPSTEPVFDEIRTALHKIPMPGIEQWSNDELKSALEFELKKNNPALSSFLKTGVLLTWLNMPVTGLEKVDSAPRRALAALFSPWPERAGYVLGLSAATADRDHLEFEDIVAIEPLGPAEAELLAKLVR